MKDAGDRRHMRVHILLDHELVGHIDELAGARGRTAFIRDAVAAEVERQRRWAAFERAFGSIPDYGADLPADWIERMRRGEPI